MQFVAFDLSNLCFLYIANGEINFYKAIWIANVKNINLRGFGYLILLAGGKKWRSYSQASSQRLKSSSLPTN